MADVTKRTRNAGCKPSTFHVRKASSHQLKRSGGSRCDTSIVVHELCLTPSIPRHTNWNWSRTATSCIKLQRHAYGMLKFSVESSTACRTDHPKFGLAHCTFSKSFFSGTTIHEHEDLASTKTTTSRIFLHVALLLVLRITGVENLQLWFVLGFGNINKIFPFSLTIFSCSFLFDCLERFLSKNYDIVIHHVSHCNNYFAYSSSSFVSRRRLGK